MTDDTSLPGGVVHDLPGDLEAALKLDREALATWQDITPLARNEWICWVEFAEESGDQAQTRRLGPLEPRRRQAPALLLAGLPASLTAAKAKCPLSTHCAGAKPQPPVIANWSARLDVGPEFLQETRDCALVALVEGPPLDPLGRIRKAGIDERLEVLGGGRLRQTSVFPR